jgi:hypothetical protein
VTLHRTAPLLLAVALLALAAGSDAAALDCPNVPLPDRIDAADGAFVGRIASSRPAEDDERVYRFLVDQPVKGAIGPEVEVRAPPLVDAADERVPVDVAVGVLVRQEGASWTTESCLLTDPGALLSASDEARGNWIKVLIGTGILTLVLAYSLRRLQRRRVAQAGGDPSTNGRPGAP